MTGIKIISIDQYIETFPEATQKLLQKIRTTIQKAAPEAKETINYGIPTFTLNGNLVHFAAFKNHIGFYALPTGHKAFQEEFSVYKTGKGSVQFPFDQPLPLALISKVVKFRVKENLEKQRRKRVKK
jgi:uncharacterized protein YdhG (YjbR/CyaY superfamily)